MLWVTRGRRSSLHANLIKSCNRIYGSIAFRPSMPMVVPFSFVGPLPTKIWPKTWPWLYSLGPNAKCRPPLPYRPHIPLIPPHRTVYSMSFGFIPGIEPPVCVASWVFCSMLVLNNLRSWFRGAGAQSFWGTFIISYCGTGKIRIRD